jgi:ribose 1,5-bisphosphokinase
MRGTLVLVVGPSGAGKDSIMGGARAALADDPAIVFARRAITRPAEAGGEDHEPVDEAVFATLPFLLHWRAHGLRYGIPARYGDDLAAGRTVVANVSRTVLDEARIAYPPVLVASIEASTPVLAARLAARGRETADDIAQRLERAGAFTPAGADVERVLNDGALADAVATFTALLRRTRSGGQV